MHGRREPGLWLLLVLLETLTALPPLGWIGLAGLTGRNGVRNDAAADGFFSSIPVLAAPVPIPAPAPARPSRTPAD